MSRLALGTAQFGLPYGVANQFGQVSYAEASSIIKLACSEDIDMLDTAILYGESELRLGNIGVKDFKLVTKLPSSPIDCLDINSWIRQQFKESLLRMRISDAYGLLLHRSDQLLGENGEAIYRALLELKDSGQVQKIGISIYSPSELERLPNHFLFDLVQAPFNLVDRRMLSSGWLNRLKDMGVEIHTRSTFLQGLLLMPQAKMPRKFLPWNDIWQKWYLWLAENDCTALQACLNFSFSCPEIDRIIVGADSQTQLEQIVNAANHLLKYEFPNLQSDDQGLVNPSNWSLL